MSTVDTRIVELRLNNTQFMAGVKETLSALSTLDKATKMSSAAKGLSDLNAAANKVDLTNIATQADKANSKLGSINTKGITDITGAANQVNMGHVGEEADRATSKLSSISTKGLAAITAAADRVNLSRIWSQADRTNQSINSINGKGLTNLTAAANQVNLSSIGKQADQVQAKISAMSAAGAASIGMLASKIASSAAQMAKSLSFGPIMDGFKEYETGLNSVQTILANTQAAGTTLPQVNASLKDLNHYADQTIYNFGEMTRNMGTFTAAGVDLKTAQTSIKGIANLAALSGSNSQQASTAMYQLSQAISSGKVSLMDWNSVVNAGMGGTVFQRALANTAVHMGKLDKNAVTLKGSMKNVTIEGQSFRDSISAENGPSWLTSDVLTNTLSQLSGSYTDAELKAQGFSDTEIKAIQSQAKTAMDAATKVKTFSQLLDTTREAVGSGWADTWQIIFGDFEGAKSLWSGVSGVVSDMVGKSSAARNKVLGDWAKLGGRTDFLEGLKNAFKGMASVIKPIKDAFREIFPATTGKQLAEMSKTFREFTSHLKLGSETANNLKRTFAGVFAIFGIGWEIIKQVAKTFFGLFKGVGEGSGGILKFTGSIGDFLVSLHKAVKEGEGFKKFFEIIGKIIQVPIKLIASFAHMLGNLFTGQKISTGPVEALKSSVSPLKSIGEFISKAWQGVKNALSGVMDALAPVGHMFKSVFGAIKDSMSGGGGIDFENIFGGLEAGALAGIGLLLKKMFDKIKDAADDVSGILDKITAPFEALTGTLEQMQNTLKAATLLQIAIAIGILAASVVSLSKVDADGLKRALTAMAVSFTQLIAAMAIFQKISIGKGFGQLILLAAALKILSSAVISLASLDWEGLAKGLIGTSVLLAGLVLAANMMPDGKKMMSSSAGLVVMAVAVKILASAVKDLGELNWDELAKGLIGVGGILAGLVLFTKFNEANKGGIAQGAGLILLAAGLKILASAVSDFGQMSWEDMAKGLIGVGGGLVIVAGALRLMPPASILSAAAILVVASSLGMIGNAVAKMGGLAWEDIGKGLLTMGAALAMIGTALNLIPPTTLLSAAAILVVASAITIISAALKIMAGFSWEEIAKGLIMLGGSLTIIAIAMNAMVLALPGAAALLVVAGALAILAPILIAFGAMAWEDIGKGLVALAGAFTVVGLAGLLLTPVIPALMGLAIAIGLLGAGAALAGIGLLSVGAGLTMIGTAGATAVPVMLSLVSGLISTIPQVATALAQAFTTFIATIATNAPLIVTSFVKIVSDILVGLQVLIPQFASLITTIIQTILAVINANAPSVISTFTNVVIQLLQAVQRITPQLMSTFSTLLQGFLTVIRNNTPAIMATFSTLLQGVLGVIRNNTPGIVNTFMTILDKLLDAAVRAVPKLVDAGGKIIIGFLRGITQKIPQIAQVAGDLIIAFINAIGNQAGRIAEAGAQTIIKFINSLATTIRGHSAELGDAGGNLAEAIVEGVIKGLGAGVKRAAQAAANLAKEAWNAAKSWLHINSPSKKFAELGKFSAEGYAKGLNDNSDAVKAARDSMRKFLDAALADEKKNVANLEAQLKRLNSARWKNNAAIKSTTASLNAARAELAKTQKANEVFNAQQTEINMLINRNQLLDAAKTKIDETTKAYEDAIKKRDDYRNSTRDTFANLPDVSKDVKLADYVKDLEKRVVDTQIFKAQLEKLKSLGLNDEMYRELVAKGVDAVPFVTQLLDQGAGAVKQINELDSALYKASDSLADSASHVLYDAGVNTTRGLMEGAKSEEWSLRTLLDHLAGIMSKEMKDALGIKSPSRVFMEIGGWTIAGLVEGLKRTAPVEEAATNIGESASTALKKSLSSATSGAVMNMDLTPTIKPVLDLSNVESNAGKIQSMLATNPLQVSGSYEQAMGTYAQLAMADEVATKQKEQSVAPVSFVQNNYSPESLSEAEIYRNTKNQLSRVKEVIDNRA